RSGVSSQGAGGRNIARRTLTLVARNINASLEVRALFNRHGGGNEIAHHVSGAPDLKLFARRHVAGHRPLDYHLPGADFRLDVAFRTHGEAMVIEADGALELPFYQQI